MSLQDNTNELQAILEAVNALPEQNPPGYAGEFAIENVPIGQINQDNSVSVTFSGKGLLYGYSYNGTLYHSYIEQTVHNIYLYANMAPPASSMISRSPSIGGSVSLSYSGNTATITVTAPSQGAYVLQSGSFRFYYIK